LRDDNREKIEARTRAVAGRVSLQPGTLSFRPRSCPPITRISITASAVSRFGFLY
jgi:hypothetical protein